MSNYTIKDITTLEGMAAIRHRSGMYIGSVEEDGIHHIALEIISNSIDEYLGGYCNKISVAVDSNDTVTVIDNGRGIPFGKAKDGTETMENIFTKLHTGAKFNSDGSAAYNSSGGLNGIGAKATNALSEFFNVTSVRDNKKAVIMFKKGIKQSFKVQNLKSSETGTTIEFQPDKEIFKNGISLNEGRLKKQLQELSYLCKGLEISFTYKNSPEIKFKSLNGIVDYIENISTNKITSIFNTQSVVDRYSVDIAFAYSSNYSENVKLYTNNIPNTSGTHLTGFRAAMTRTINECAKDIKLLKEKDTNLTGEDLKEGLILILSLYMPDPVFSGQTKEVLTSAEGRTVVERMLMSELKRWFQANPNELKAIVNKALLSKKAREAAKRAREATRGKSKTVLTTTLQGKLADCISRDPDVAELILVEGQSAGGSVKEGRNRQTQAVMALQGKR